MKDVLLRRTLLALLITILCGVVFHAPLSVWLGTVFPEQVLLIKSWKELLLGASVLLVAIEVSRRGMWKQLLGDWLIRLSVAFSAVHLLVLPFFWQGVEPTFAGLLIDLRFVVFFVVMYMSLKLYPHWRKPLLLGSVAAAVVSLTFAVLQVTVLPHDVLKHIGYDKDTTIAPYLTVDKNYNYVRVNGTLRGPNPLGAYAIIVLSLALAALLMIPKKLGQVSRWLPWVVGALGVTALVALWFSYSRSALVAGVAAAGVVLGATVVRKAPRLSFMIAGVLLAGMIGLVALNWNSSVVQNIILHENRDGGSEISSNDGHAESLETGWHRMITQPFGAGVGSTGSASLLGDNSIIIENQYLFVAHEVGWLGLALFVALFGLVLYRLWRASHDYVALGVLASGLGLAAIGLLLPVWVDDTVAMVWWALAAIALTGVKPVEKVGKTNE